MAPNGPEWSGGVNSTLSPVNSESKYLVSVSLLTNGLNGGGILKKLSITKQFKKYLI